MTGLPLDTTPKTRILRDLGITDTRFFFDSLMTTTFGVLINNDPPTPTPIKVYQEKKPDIEFFGNLMHDDKPDEVIEFRSLSKGSRGLIPGLRAKHKDEEKYPLAAISYGDGYLIVAGMSVSGEVEFNMLKSGMTNFIIEIANRHKIK